MKNKILLTSLFLLLPLRLLASVDISFSGNLKSQKNCTLTTSIIDVSLGSARVSDFSSPSGFATVTRNETLFNIPLQCIAGTAVQMSIKTKNAYVPSTGAMLINSGTGMAYGVYVQMLFQKDRTAVVPGKLYSIDTASTTGKYDIPLIARYMNNAAVKMTVGAVNLSIDLTLQYN